MPTHLFRPRTQHLRLQARVRACVAHRAPLLRGHLHKRRLAESRHRLRATDVNSKGLLAGEADAGEIIHQCVPNLSYGDKIHDVSCKAIISASDDMVRLLSILEKEKSWKKFKQTGGKNFLYNDFKSEHLRVIYNLFNDDIVDQYLSGKIKSNPPNLLTQF